MSNFGRSSRAVPGTASGRRRVHRGVGSSSVRRWRIAHQLNSRIAAARRAAQAARCKRRVAEAGRKISDYVQAGLLEEAANELAKAEQEIAGEPALAKWRRNLADRQRRNALDTRVQKAVETSRRLLEQRNFKEAQGVLLAAESEFGPAPALKLALEVTEQSWQQYLDTINSALAEIRSMREREDWDDAIATAVSKSEQFPEEPRFRALAAEIQDKREAQGRQADVEARINQIRPLPESGRLEEAAVLISAAFRQHPGDPLLVELREKLDLLERARMERQRKRKGERPSVRFWPPSGTKRLWRRSRMAWPNSRNRRRSGI